MPSISQKNDEGETSALSGSDRTSSKGSDALAAGRTVWLNSSLSRSFTASTSPGAYASFVPPRLNTSSATFFVAAKLPYAAIFLSICQSPPPVSVYDPVPAAHIAAVAAPGAVHSATKAPPPAPAALPCTATVAPVATAQRNGKTAIKGVHAEANPSLRKAHTAPPSPVALLPVIRMKPLIATGRELFTAKPPPHALAVFASTVQSSRAASESSPT